MLVVLDPPKIRIQDLPVIYSCWHINCNIQYLYQGAKKTTANPSIIDLALSYEEPLLVRCGLRGRFVRWDAVHLSHPAAVESYCDGDFGWRQYRQVVSSQGQVSPAPTLTLR